MSITIASADGLMKGLAGDLFDIVCSRLYLANQGHNIHRITEGSRIYGRPRGGGSGGDEVNPLPANSPELEDFKTINCGPWVKLTDDAFVAGSNFQIEDGVLYEQRHRTTQSIDSFLVVEARVIFFQITVSSTHKVRGHGIVQMVEALEKKLNRIFTQIEFVFVIPAASNTPLHTIQALTTDSDRNYASFASIPVRIKQLATVQYVMPINTEAFFANQHEEIMTIPIEILPATQVLEELA